MRNSKIVLLFSLLIALGCTKNVLASPFSDTVLSTVNTVSYIANENGYTNSYLPNYNPNVNNYYNQIAMRNCYLEQLQRERIARIQAERFEHRFDRHRDEEHFRYYR